MSETWANGLDLHLDVSGTRVRSRLEAALRDSIRSGRLAEGARLPSSRTLAADLGIARNTVAEAYTQLTAEGWLTARSGSGTTVAPLRGPAPDPGPEAAEAAAHPRYDLWPGEPDLSAFPRGEWLTAARKAIADAPDAVFGYGDSRGLPALRGALAEYLARTRGVVTTPGGENIVICSGFAHGLELICRALRAAGAGTVAVEEYGHPGHRDIIARQGLKHPAAPARRRRRRHRRGRRRRRGRAHPRAPVPAGHDAGAGPPPVVRGVGRDRDRGRLRRRVPLRPAAGRRHAGAGAGPGRLLRDGEQEPGPRRPPGLARRPPVAARRGAACLTGGPSALDQLTLAEFVTSGGYDRQIRRARLAYRHRRDRLISALDVLGLRVGGIAAGLHVLVDLPATTAEVQAVTRGGQHGLALSGLGWYDLAHDAARAGLVIGYARPPEHAYTTAIARLCAVLTP